MCVAARSLASLGGSQWCVVAGQNHPHHAVALGDYRNLTETCTQYAGIRYCGHVAEKSKEESPSLSLSR